MHWNGCNLFPSGAMLDECGWRIKGKSNVAERLGLHPSTLQHRLKKLGIERPRA